MAHTPDGRSRREALKQMGLGMGALAAAGCGLGTPALECPAGPPSTTGNALLAGVEAIVVVMMENRSFDHQFGALCRDPAYAARHIVDGTRGDEANPDEAGAPVAMRRLDFESRHNPEHKWDPQHQAWNGGRNDGFVRANAGHEGREAVMGFHDRERLPFQYALADAFTICDRWFASVMSSTWPNRYHLHAATSDGQRGNQSLGFAMPPTVWDRLAERCVPAKNYFSGPLPWYAAAFPARTFSGNDSMVPSGIEEFFRDARAGTLPAFSIIDPDYLSNDAHPRHDLGLAEAFLAAIYRALAESPQWPRCLLVITHDEGGGFYDHVAPPSTVDPRPEFRQLGFRVPTTVVGPAVFQGGVVSATLEHVSVLATLRTRFGIRSLGPRMDATADLSACLDPARVGQAAPAPKLPVVTLSQRRELGRPPGPPSQPELFALLADRRVPAALVDPRSHQQRLRGWLRWAQELEAVKVVW